MELNHLISYRRKIQSSVESGKMVAMIRRRNIFAKSVLEIARDALQREQIEVDE